MIELYIKAINTTIKINNSITTFCFKDVNQYRNIYFNIENAIILSYNGECIDIGKKVTIIKDISEVSCNDKKMINYLYKCIEKSISNDLSEQFSELNRVLIQVLDEVIDKNEFNLTYNPDINITKVFSSLDLQFQNYGHDEYLRSLLQYFNLVNSVTKSKIFITFNLNNFITTTEYEMLLKEFELMNINVINFEKFTTSSTIDYVIDDDNCIY